MAGCRATRSACHRRTTPRLSLVLDVGSQPVISSSVAQGVCRDAQVAPPTSWILPGSQLVSFSAEYVFSLPELRRKLNLVTPIRSITCVRWRKPHGWSALLQSSQLSNGPQMSILLSSISGLLSCKLLHGQLIRKQGLLVKQGISAMAARNSPGVLTNNLSLAVPDGSTARRTLPYNEVDDVARDVYDTSKPPLPPRLPLPLSRLERGV